MELTDATRLLAPGVEITLRDSVSRRLIFDFEAFCLIEAEMGSIEAFEEALRGRATVQIGKRTVTLGAWSRKRATAVRAGVLAGLAHYGMARAQVVKLLDFKKVDVYFHAVDEAYVQALPEQGPEDALPNPRGEADSTSPGNGSTTTPRSASVGATTSSGG